MRAATVPQATTAGRLAARYVIHTVGPVWHGGQDREDELLASCHRSALEAVGILGYEDDGLTSLADHRFGRNNDSAGIRIRLGEHLHEAVGAQQPIGVGRPHSDFNRATVAVRSAVLSAQ